jgi:hypothetical protein
MVMTLRVPLALVLALTVILGASPRASAQAMPEARLKAIYAMSPEDMAATGAWTKSAYDRLLAHISIYEVYQSAGFKADAAKDFVLSVLKDSASYEVPKR